MTLWTALSAFIYVLLLPSCLRLRVAETRKSAVNGHPVLRDSSTGFIFPRIPSDSNLAAVSGSCCFHTTTGLIHTCHIKPQSFPLYLRCASLCLPWFLLQAEPCSSLGYPWCYYATFAAVLVLRFVPVQSVLYLLQCTPLLCWIISKIVKSSALHELPLLS